VIAAGIYELTPLKRHYRLRCREDLRSGLEFGLCCVGSSIGLMAVLLAVAPMNLAWTAVIAGLALEQKVLPLKTGVDVPVALGIVGLGVLILLEPTWIPGLMLAM
jgi:predicted metal-binding membrane protein